MSTEMPDSARPEDEFSENFSTRLQTPATRDDFDNPTAILEYATTLPTVPLGNEGMDPYLIRDTLRFRTYLTPFPNVLDTDIDIAPGQLFYRPTWDASTIIEITGDRIEGETPAGDKYPCKLHYRCEIQGEMTTQSPEDTIAVASLLDEHLPVPSQTASLDSFADEE